MNLMLRQLLLALSVAASASTAFAQGNAATSAPAVTAQPVASPAAVPGLRYIEKGPVSLYVDTLGDDLTYLRIVHRSNVLAGNIARLLLPGSQARTARKRIWEITSPTTGNAATWPARSRPSCPKPSTKN